VGLNQFEVLLSVGLAYTAAISPLFHYGGHPAASLFSCFFHPAVSGLALTDTSSCSVATLDVAHLTASALPAAGTTYYVVVSSVAGSPNSVMVRLRCSSSSERVHTSVVFFDPPPLPLHPMARSVKCVPSLSDTDASRLVLQARIRPNAVARSACLSPAALA
jgi:hypothetical protein